MSLITKFPVLRHIIEGDGFFEDVIWRRDDGGGRRGFQSKDSAPRETVSLKGRACWLGRTEAKPEREVTGDVSADGSTVLGEAVGISAPPKDWR